MKQVDVADENSMMELSEDPSERLLPQITVKNQDSTKYRSVQVAA